MKKELREKVFNKYGGKCAYCSNGIEYKDMQVDHLTPRNRAHYYDSEPLKKIYGIVGDSVDSFVNLAPSCRRCNHYKRSHTLEEFRTLITSLCKKISKLYIGKVANDYGLIIFKLFDGKFYFEKISNQGE